LTPPNALFPRLPFISPPPLICVRLRYVPSNQQFKDAFGAVHFYGFLCFPPLFSHPFTLLTLWMEYPPLFSLYEYPSQSNPFDNFPMIVRLVPPSEGVIDQAVLVRFFSTGVPLLSKLFLSTHKLAFFLRKLPPLATTKLGHFFLIETPPREKTEVSYH